MSPFTFISARLSARDAPTSRTLSRGASIGLALDTEGGLLSSIAASCVLVLISRRIYRTRSWDGMDVYVISLFIAEVIQGLGHSLDLKWVIEGQLNTGTFCTTQGVLRQLGAVVASLITSTIAVQTFVTIWWLKDPSTIIAIIMTGVVWIFVTLFVAISYALHTHPGKEYYASPTPFWCWIGQGFAAERIAGEYFWFWFTLFISFALYLPLLLLYLGVIREGDSWWSPAKIEPEGEGEPKGSSSDVNEGGDQAQSVHSRTAIEPTAEFRTKSAKVWTAIAYPSVYCLMILPLSVVRWIGFQEEAVSGYTHIAASATFAGEVVFALSGVWNAVLYILTRPLVILGEDDESVSGENASTI